MTVKLRSVDNKVIHEANVDTLGEALEDAVKKGVSLKGVNLEGAKLRNVNLKGANLGGANFNKAKLQNVCLEGASLIGMTAYETKFHAVNAKNADFNGAEFYNKAESDRSMCTKYGFSMSKVSFRRSKIQMSNFQGANFKFTTLGNTKIENSNFKDVNFEKTKVFMERKENRDTDNISKEKIRNGKDIGCFFTTFVIEDIAKFNKVELDPDMPRILRLGKANVKNPIVNGVKQPTGIVASLKKALGR
ncbi:MAG: pentapeptide repeat-containing protein [Alphaproteobacteria bacterium]|nr:pentapeptide repeat-containing protein [Alphaproteobacteria bacterium]